MLRLKGPANERSEATTAILLSPNPLQMLDSIFDRLHVTEHHRGAGFQSELMRHLHHLQPFVAVYFQRRNPLPYAVHENFAPATRDRAEPGILKLRNHFSQRHPECLREMLKLRRTEPVNIDVRIFLADMLQKIDVP